MLLQRFDHGIAAVDVEFTRVGMATAHILIEQGRVAIIDCGTNLAVPIILDALRELDIATQQVDLLILTHVHLDHAGGADALMQALPNARLVVHPRGARHMIDPSKLMAAATAVYGEAVMQKNYGTLQPIPEQRVVVTHDEQVIELADRPLLFLDTPGHCKHHHCVYDRKSRGVFSGDNFGVSYRELDVAGRALSIPTTSPSQFDPSAAHNSITRLMSLSPEWMFMTHYTRVGDLARIAADLHELLDGYVDIAEKHRNMGSDRKSTIEGDLKQLILAKTYQHGVTLSEAAILEILGVDIELNAQGLDVWLSQ